MGYGLPRITLDNRHRKHGTRHDTARSHHGTFANIHSRHDDCARPDASPCLDGDSPDFAKMRDDCGSNADYSFIPDSHQLWLRRLDDGVIANPDTLSDLDPAPAMLANT